MLGDGDRLLRGGRGSVGRAGERVRRRCRGEELRQDHGARALHHPDARVPGPAAAAERREPARGSLYPDARPGPQLPGERLRAPDERVRRRRALLRLGEPGLRPADARAVHRPRRRDALRQRLGDPRRPRVAPRGRDHDRLGAGPGDPLLGPRGDAREARLRGPHLRRAGAGALGHASARDPTRWRGCPRRRASRSTTGPRTPSTSCSRRRPAPTSLGRAARPARAMRRSRAIASRRASTPRTTRTGRSSTPRASGSQGIRWGQRPSRSSARRTRASMRWSPGTTSTTRRRGAPSPRRPARRRPRPASRRRSRSRRSGCRTTTS